MQFPLSEAERERLGDRIQTDYRAARDNHQRRIDRFVRYYRLWRGRVDPPRAKDKDKPTFSVPLLKWQVFGQLAHVMQSLFGQDAEITAQPTAPHDEKIVHKVGRYMTWRVFAYMRILRPLCVWIFRAVVFGRAHAYVPWRKRTWVKDGEEQISYDAPDFEPLWPDELMVPAEDVSSIQEFSVVIRRYRLTPQDILEGAKRGIYDEKVVNKEFGRMLAWAVNRRERDDDQDIRAEKDWAEGVAYESALGSRDSLECWEWYSHWSPLKEKSDGTLYVDARLDNLKRREMKQVHLVARYLKDLNLVIGVQDLAQIYPSLPPERRRPFVELALVEDGSYWCPGFGELLEDIENEMTANHQLFTQAGKFSVGPIIFYSPGNGWDPDVMEYEPNIMVPCADPSKVNAVRMQADMTYPITKEQVLGAIAERVTGRSDFSLGRSSDRPNAPRTATGQVALLEQGNVRASLDMYIIRDYLGGLLEHIWALDCYFAPESVFFRATEEEANGLFETKQGFAKMTAEERTTNFDFKIKFADSVYSREAQKARDLALYQLDLSNPIVVQNPAALWEATRRAHKALGDSNFADMVPRPPQLDGPKAPKEEWTMVLQGEEVQVHPADNDDLHMIDHRRRLEEASRQPEERRDHQAENMMVAHIMSHNDQKRQKMVMQALTERMVQDMDQNVYQPLQQFQQLLIDESQPPEEQQQPGGSQPRRPSKPNGQTPTY